MAGAVALFVTDTDFVPAARRAPDAEALIAAVAAHGDRAAFARLYGEFAPRVKAYLMRGGVAPGEAEDIAQEAMVRVWRRAPTFDPGKASVATWIFTIARNLRIDHLRRRARTSGESHERAEAPDDAPPADDEFDRKSRDARLRRIFGKLPPNQQRVVLLHFYEDEPHSAIARRLGLPLGTVKSRLRLAFARIRRELEESELK